MEFSMLCRNIGNEVVILPRVLLTMLETYDNWDWNHRHVSIQFNITDEILPILAYNAEFLGVQESNS